MTATDVKAHIAICSICKSCKKTERKPEEKASMALTIPNALPIKFFGWPVFFVLKQMHWGDTCIIALQVHNTPKKI